MSKLTDLLSRLGQSPPAGLGFGAAARRERTPVILTAGPSGLGDAVDVHMDPFKSGIKHPGSAAPWGVSAADLTDRQLTALKKDGCDFIVIESGDASAAVLGDEDVAAGYVLPEKLTDREVRAIEDAPLDFLICEAAGTEWPLTISGFLKLQELVSLFTRHIFLRMDRIPTGQELKLLRDLPVSALVFSGDSPGAEEIAGLKKCIADLEPRQQRQRPSPLIPGGAQPAHSQSGYDDEEEDDDWDD